MFSSPAVRPFASENADNLLQRKPGTNQISRKPFVDRSVNSKTPDVNKFVKSKLLAPKDKIGQGKLSPKAATLGGAPKITLSPKVEDLDANDFMFSGKDFGEAIYNDYWPEVQLDRKGIINCVRSYCLLEDTPPPSPVSERFDVSPIKIDPMFLEMTDDDDFHAYPLEEESFEVELPQWESDDDSDISLD